MAKSVASIRMPDKIFKDPELREYFKNLNDILRDLADKPTFIKGSGAPEGVMVAKIQTHYFNLTGTTGSFAYVKTVDGGDTGWIAYA